MNVVVVWLVFMRIGARQKHAEVFASLVAFCCVSWSRNPACGEQLGALIDLVGAGVRLDEENRDEINRRLYRLLLFGVG